MRIIVTGANRGIGLEFVRQLAEAGHRVEATARNPQKATELQAFAEGKSVNVHALDVTDEQSVASFVNALGDAPVDMLINNAGVYPKSGGIGGLDYDAFRFGFEVNALAPIRLAEALLPSLRKSDQKKIVHITSQMGSIEDNGSGGAYAYRMSKAALNMGNKSLANDLSGEGFTCLAVHPGWVQTDMGGPNAKITVEKSVSSMLGAIHDRGPEQSGEFVSWNGSTLPW